MSFFARRLAGLQTTHINFWHNTTLLTPQRRFVVQHGHSKYSSEPTADICTKPWSAILGWKGGLSSLNTKTKPHSFDPHIFCKFNTKTPRMSFDIEDNEKLEGSDKRRYIKSVSGFPLCFLGSLPHLSASFYRVFRPSWPACDKQYFMAMLATRRRRRRRRQ